MDEQGLAAARDHAEEVVDWALTECAGSHQEELDRLVDMVEVVEIAPRRWPSSSRAPSS